MHWERVIIDDISCVSDLQCISTLSGNFRWILARPEDVETVTSRIRLCMLRIMSNTFQVCRRRHISLRILALLVVWWSTLTNVTRFGFCLTCWKPAFDDLKEKHRRLHDSTSRVFMSTLLRVSVYCIRHWSSCRTIAERPICVFNVVGRTCRMSAPRQADESVDRTKLAS